MKKILSIVLLMFTIIQLNAQDLGDSAKTILQQCIAKPILYETPVIKTNSRNITYVESKSAISDIIYKFVISDGVCICVVHEIYSKNTLDITVNYIERIPNVKYIWDNKWVEFNNTRFGSVYYEVYKTKKGWIFTKW